MSTSKTKRLQALSIAKDLRLKIYDEQTKISTLLMGCKTVCRYLDNVNDSKWIEDELKGYDISKFKNYGEQNKLLPDYRSVPCIFYNQYGSPLLFLDSKTESMLTVFKTPNAITQLETVDDLVITGGPMIDLVNFANSKSPFRVTKAVVTNNNIHALLSALRDKINDFLDKTILELEFGGIPEQIFEDIRNDVDTKMVNLCPDAINKLQIAYENASGSNPELWSHVAASCRRIVNDVANAIFPAQKEPITLDGKQYIVTDDKSINRIIVGLKKRSISDKTFQFNKSTIEYVSSFLRNIQSYSSKGDHAIFTKTDASRCVIYTYMLFGDILTYYVESDFVTKKFGDPYDTKGGIQKYLNRKKSPFEDLLNEAKNEILFVSTSHEFVVRFKEKIIQGLLDKQIVMTVRVLHPDSPEVKRKELLFNKSNIDQVIREQLAGLCKLKSLHNNENKLRIETYNHDVKYSYIVIDPNDDNTIIKIEELPGDDPENRKSYLAYKKDNPKFFQEHWDEISRIRNIKTYDCKKLTK